MRRTLGTVLMLALATSACADPASDPSVVLDDRVDAIRLAAERGNTDRASRLLERLERTVDRLLANGLLTDDQAVALISAAGDVTQALELIRSEPSPTYSPTPSPEEGHGEEDKGHGNGGSGHGEGGD